MSELMQKHPVRLTDRAAVRVRSLIEQQGSPGLALRVYVEGGGCSGFQYGFAFDEQVADDDTRIDSDGVTLVVDPLSVQYLDGAEVDFQDDLVGARFIVRNPNATTTCGCGSSFGI